MRNLSMIVPVTLLLASACPALADQGMRGRVDSNVRGSSPAVITLVLGADNILGKNVGTVTLGNPYDCAFQIQIAETVEGQTEYAVTRSTGGVCDQLTSGRFSTSPGYNETHVLIFDNNNIERLHGGVTPAEY